ncbi:hypothetical protein PPERSA_05426 [Pseudocohnilembus persalinus]|uniref:Uncharacterized protein n=1 Tax=Pseudocohnilembus persalinus TaxID=266149 RepID=A0A0V0R7Z0_PSEPJ|nr:hypothetical protein PPERSA_05426 [Pseudocohnilembus persalinus]|eukprot:KRX10606.1 hypothetical protein PPERSA_05426 [Pseudocohnilembus persalinus]
MYLGPTIFQQSNSLTKNKSVQHFGTQLSTIVTGQNDANIIRTFSIFTYKYDASSFCYQTFDSSSLQNSTQFSFQNLQFGLFSDSKMWISFEKYSSQETLIILADPQNCTLITNSSGANQYYSTGFQQAKVFETVGEQGEAYLHFLGNSMSNPNNSTYYEVQTIQLNFDNSNQDQDQDQDEDQDQDGESDIIYQLHRSTRSSTSDFKLKQ